jgi:hypothetical protein
MKNGDRVKDKVSGYAGIVVAEHRYLNGCVRLSVQSEKLVEGKPPEAQAFDVEQLVLVKGGVHSVMARSGGPEKEPVRTKIPAR